MTEEINTCAIRQEIIIETNLHEGARMNKGKNLPLFSLGGVVVSSVVRTGQGPFLVPEYADQMLSGTTYARRRSHVSTTLVMFTDLRM